MKAVLVIDMPENCYQCLFGRNDYFSGEFICAATDDWDAIEEDYFHDKPDWCPLRPLPDKATPENSDMGISWNLGWNACLEAITGEVKV